MDFAAASSPYNRGGRPILSPPQETDEEENFFGGDREMKMSGSDDNDVQVFEDKGSSEDDDDDDVIVVLSEQELQQQYRYLEKEDRMMAMNDQYDMISVDRWTAENTTVAACGAATGATTSSSPYKMVTESIRWMMQQPEHHHHSTTDDEDPNNVLQPLSSKILAGRTSGSISPTKVTAIGNKKPSPTPTYLIPPSVEDPSIQAACELVQQIYDQIALHDAPAMNDQTSGGSKSATSTQLALVEQGLSSPKVNNNGNGNNNRVSSQRHDWTLHSRKSQAAGASISSSSDNIILRASSEESTEETFTQPGLLQQELQLHKLGGPLQDERSRPNNNKTHSYFTHLQNQPESKMGHAALGTLCSWTLDTLQTKKPSSSSNNKSNNVVMMMEKKEETENTPMVMMTEAPDKTVAGSFPTQNQTNNVSKNIGQTKTKESNKKSKWNLKSYWKKNKNNKPTTPSHSCKSADGVVMNGGDIASVLSPKSSNNGMADDFEHGASILKISLPSKNNQAFFPEDRLDNDPNSQKRDEVTETRHPEAGNSPKTSVPAPSPRLQLFGSEYARYLSTSALAPKIKSPRRSSTTALLQQSASSRYGPFSTSRGNRNGQHFGIMSNGSFGSGGFLSSSKTNKNKRVGNTYSWNLEDQDSAILAGAIVDICITNGADTPPPKGYFRLSQTVNGEEFRALKAAGATLSPRRKTCTFINVKKEPNWHRAAQRPCVTALAIIFPDRQEFVPPGFCVVREHRRRPTQLNHNAKQNIGGNSSVGGNSSSVTASGGSATGSSTVSSSGGAVSDHNTNDHAYEDTSAESASKELPANFNQGAADGERVFLCFRRSREGNPITGILPLQPAYQDAIPDGYTVMERTPRNFVASLNPKNSSPVFLAYRQRLANLEPLRPLPLVLSVTTSMTEEEDENGPKKRSKKPKLNAYYCTGGTVVEANVGRYHTLDRSTHSLLSASSVANRLSLIEISRRKSLPQLANGRDYGVPSSNTSESSRPVEASRPIEINATNTEQSSQGGDFDSVASSADLPNPNTSFGAGSSIAEYPKNSNSSFSTTGSLDHHPNLSTSITEESNEVPSVILSSFPSSSQQADGYYPKLHDPELKMSQDAMSFIPVVEIATPPSELEPQRHLRARTTLLTPILTACYQRHGGAALKAVEGLTKLLTEQDFFVDDVDWSSKNASSRLTLLDLAIQTVCDVATGGTQETAFGACVEFVEKAIQYCQGHLNTRTIGYALRFYLFVYYFGASIPTNKPYPHPSWSSFSGGDVTQSILYDPRYEENRTYLPGGAPQTAALGFKDLITFAMSRLQRVCLALPDDQTLPEGEAVESEGVNRFIGGLVSSLIDGAVHRVDVANYTQLAMHQIHRSGGSELFWHDMMTSCGTGLFGNEESLTCEAKNMYVMTFTIFANLIKVASGKIRTNAQTLELRPRDVSSKILSLELLLHFLEQYRDEQQDWMNEDQPRHQMIARCVDTMVFCIRRLVVPCLLANTRAGLEDPRVFECIAKIISVLWRTPLFRERMKGEMGLLIEHFGLRLLRLGPQLQQSRSSTQKSSNLDDLTCPLLMQQLSLLKEIKRWFSRDATTTIELYLNFDTDICSQAGPNHLMPGTQWKLFQRICASLCNLSEQCGDLIGEQIRQSQSLESPSGSSKNKLPGFFDAIEPQSNEKREDQRLEMESIREGARRLRTASLDAIVQILRCLARTSAVATGKEFYALVSSWSDPGDPDEFGDGRMPDIPSPAASADESEGEEEERLGGPGSVLNFWRNQVASRTKKPKPYVYTFENDVGLLNSVTRDTAFEIAKKKSIKKAVEYLIACNALTPSPRDIASFLRIHKDRLDQSALGNYLGEGGLDGQETEYWNLIRFSYVRAISFDGLCVEEGLRHFLTNCGFRLPGEAQKIDRIMSTFAQCYWEDNAGDRKHCPFQDQDTVYLLAFAIIMLNTDLHKSGVDCTGKGGRKKMTKQEFVKNLSGAEGTEELTREYLSCVYDSIEATPIMLMHDDLDAQNLAGPAETRTRMLRSMLGNVRSADALLRGISVHDFKWASMQDFSSSLAYESSDALSDLTRSCISEAWHQFHGVVNTALEAAHLDPQGMEPCVDLLKYALVVTICLDMPMERAAFLSQLGRFKVFEGNYHNSNQPYWVPDEEQGRHLLLQGNSAFDRAMAGPLDDESKLKALVQVHEATQDLRSALKVDIQVKQEMTRVTKRILDSDFLLNDPGRSFLRQGDLKKKSNRSGRQMDYRFFLFSDVLIYAKKVSSSSNNNNKDSKYEENTDSKDEYKIHEELPLHLMKIVDWFPPSSMKDTKKAFQVHHPRKTFMVFCSSSEERVMWVRDIRKAIEREIKKKVEMEATRMAAASLGASNTTSMMSQQQQHQAKPVMNVRIPTPRPF